MSFLSTVVKIKDGGCSNSFNKLKIRINCLLSLWDSLTLLIWNSIKQDDYKIDVLTEIDVLVSTQIKIEHFLFKQSTYLLSECLVSYHASWFPIPGRIKFNAFTSSYYAINSLLKQKHPNYLVSVANNVLQGWYLIVLQMYFKRLFV